MAEKNTESTAINELIELVATAKPLPPDPDEDLMFKAPSKKTKRMMTATVPPVGGAGDIAPLPRARSPLGTNQNLQTIKATPPAVRVSTAPPQRVVTIPPIADAQQTDVQAQQTLNAHAPLTLDDYAEDGEVTNPGPQTFARPTAQGFAAAPSERPSQSQPIATRVTKPTIPPPFPAGATLTGRASSPRPSLNTTKDFAYPIVQPSMLPASLKKDSVPEIEAPLPSSASWAEQDIGTDQVAKQNNWKSIAGKLIAPMIVLVIAGIFIGGYFAFDGDGKKKKKDAPPAEGEKIAMPVTTEEAAPAPAPAAKVEEAAPVKPEEPAPTKVEEPAPTKVAETKVAEPAPTKVAEPAPAPAASTDDKKAPATKPTLVDIRIDSYPSGATVNLVDRGKTTYLGTTPMSAAVDVSRKYELVFSYENRATLIESLDPTSTKRVNVKLQREKRASSSSAPRTDRPKIETPTFDAPKAEAPKAEAPKVEPVKIEVVKTEAPKVEASGEGVLMISSKPPCEIHIDGKPTGLMTPQRDIKLPAGAHKVTLVNAAEGIKKTVSVQITADKPTKVIQDFMK